MAEMDAAQRMSPKDPRVLINRGLVLGVLKRPKEAAEAFAEAARAAPDDPLLQVLLADSYAEVGEWDLALSAATKALSLDPKLAAAHAARAYVALRQGNTEDAAAGYREAARLDPKNARHVYFLGRVHEKGNDLKQAERQYRTALAKDPDNVTYMLAVGGVLLKRGQGKQALTIYKGATKAAPDDEDVWIRYGHAAADAGKSEDAAKAFERALVLEPNNPATLLSLGIVYEVGLRDREKAIETYRAYVAAGGKDARVKRWLAALEAKK
jgi:tetratricopeptide (TPR) repeat protein